MASDGAAQTPAETTTAEAAEGARPGMRFHKGSARMFRSDFLERFSHVHPATPFLAYTPVAITALVVALRAPGASPLGVVARVVAGYGAWTLFEYWLHRLLFHLKVVGPQSKRLYFWIHGVHHDWPWDMSRLVIPPGASIVLCGLMYGAFRLLFGSPGLYPYFSGFVAGYVFYDSVHWYVHARAPRTRFGKWLRREHMVHHFKDNTTRFGVSCPWWDHVFGTTGAPKTAPQAEAGPVVPAMRERPAPAARAGE